MNLAVIAAIAYGSLALIGGILGYTRAQSKASLISGCISGGLLLLAAWLQVQTIPVGLILAQVVTLLLVVVFVVRLLKTRKFMPAGLMVIAGAIALSLMLAR